MTSTIKPLASTLRVLEWDELPASVRAIPVDFDPLAEGVLMKHQREVAALSASIIAIPKGRRTGITFGTMLNKTIVAASRKSAGGDNVFYIGDTKEKGLEAIGYCAKFARLIAQAQGEGVSGIEEFLFEDQDENGKTRHINAYRIRFASGFQVCALSSRPANIRGLQGHVVIDEAAFHPDVQGVLDAATALLIWGGQITVISSHNGKGPFWQLCLDIEAGRYGDDAVVKTVTFDDAVTNGLFEHVCMMQGTVPTAEGKAAWYAKIRNGYGVRKAAMREELDAIPRDGNGVCLPGVWIEQAMVLPPENVLRLALDDDFVRLSPEERASWVADWIERYLAPALAQLDPRLRHVFSHDYARHRDFSCWGAILLGSGMRRQLPLAIEMHKVPYAQQKQITWYAIERLPNRCGGAMDATGSGETLAEETADRFGHTHVHQVKLSRSWYALPLTLPAASTGKSVLAAWARAITRYLLNKSRIQDESKDPIARDYRDAQKMLTLLAQGKYSLGADDPAQSGAGAGTDVRFAGAQTVFGRDQLRAFR